MDGYTYPGGKHRRKHGPLGYRSVGEFRDWLRDEFAFRCVYCLEREQWANCLGHFHIEHFEPVAMNPDRELEYDNLLYSCQACNLLKGSQAVPDPLTVFTAVAVVVQKTGRILGKTADARRLIEILQLNSPGFRKRRRLMIEILATAAKANPALCRELLAFPEDLPDLARLKPPGGNTRPSGIKKTYFVLRRAGRLPETY
ncbi:MAG: hypothetical protein JWM11_3452 [Planctomycetaceae bacterium]|nr:hypothetical protein [Planctomycetaceae bacterium]